MIRIGGLRKKYVSNHKAGMYIVYFGVLSITIGLIVCISASDGESIEAKIVGGVVTTIIGILFLVYGIGSLCIWKKRYACCLREYTARGHTHSPHNHAHQQNQTIVAVDSEAQQQAQATTGQCSLPAETAVDTLPSAEIYQAVYTVTQQNALSGEPGRVVVIVSCASCKQPIICNSCQAQRAETRHDRLQSTESSDTDCDQIDKEDNRDEASGERRGSDDSIASLPEKAEATPSGGERNVVEKRASPVLEMNITEKEPNI